MSHKTRSGEAFQQSLDKSMYNFDDMRLLPTQVLARHIDAEAVNKCRLSLYGQQKRAIHRMAERSEEYEDMERCRSTKGDYRLDPREWDLGDTVGEVYFNYYGSNYYGGEIVNSPDEPYICPKCGLKYKMSHKTLPEHCKWCNSLTPIGMLVRDRVLQDHHF